MAKTEPKAPDAQEPSGSRWPPQLPRPLLSESNFVAAAVVGALALAVVAMGARTKGKAQSRGEQLFTEKCAVCHSRTEQAGVGPGLAGVLGRKAASSDFAYSSALRNSRVVWDKAAFDAYLENPTQYLPGTTMVVAVSRAEDRRDLFSYLATLKKDKSATGVMPATVASAKPIMRPAAPAASFTGRAAFGDYRSDGPGVRRRITLDAVPAPYETQSARNGARLAPPPDALPYVPPGFHVSVLASGLGAPRRLRVSPSGEVFLADTAGGGVRVLTVPSAHGHRDTAHRDAGAPRASVYAQGLDGPFGLAFYPPGHHAEWLYVAEQNRVVRYAYTAGDVVARGASEVVIPEIAPSKGGHTTRDIAFSPDGKRMFVSVGSQSNVAEGMKQKSPDEVAAWESEHGLGATWGLEERRADVLVYSMEALERGESGAALGRVYASGIRNCVGLAIDPHHQLWCATNERDGLGDDLVPDYVSRVEEGSHFGWPWHYLGDHEDPRHPGARADLASKVRVPDVLLQPHSAALQVTFYDGKMFGREYSGDGFVTLHGSWNRAERTGYKVVRIPMHEGKPTGEYEDFMTGFVFEDGRVWGRPVGIGVAADGALLVTEDAHGTLFRIARSDARTGAVVPNP